MRHFGFAGGMAFGVLLIAFLMLFPGDLLAHCDTLDGPVIAAAKQALETGNIKPVLSWVQPGDEQQMQSLFQKTMAVRKLSPEARDFADMYFYETLVRVHRAGEGAPYTGLKPAGQVEASVALADKAVETGAANKLVKELNGAVSQGIQNRLNILNEKKKHANESVAAGRDYVAAYVEFVHYVEKLHGDAVAGADEHASATKQDQGATINPDHKAAHKHQ